MPVDVLGTLRQVIDKADDPRQLNAVIAPEPTKVVVGAFGQSSGRLKLEGTPDTPFVQIRARGGVRSANWTPEGTRRVDVFAFGDSYIQADTLSQSVDDYLVRIYNYDYNFTDDGVDYSTRIQYLETESDGIDGIDDDTNLPFMFRSYIVAYAEGA